ncbi:MAG: class I SAM-dependent RNA methyltransferase [Chloroflexi bacterium]|nr:class I SAM-dependent RNA methyltransferase [Chloroflexota bacterium]
MENLIKLTIDALVYEGFGFGRLPDGKAVFIPFVMPGEEVIGEVIEEKPGHIRARLLSVEKPHPQRIQPRCAHFGVCGGCHYQHIPYELQLEFKKAIFKEQLQRIASLDDSVVKMVIPSALEWNYRNSLQFGLDDHAKQCFTDIYLNEFFAVQECHLPMDEISQVWPLTEFEKGVDIDRIEYRQNEEGYLMMVLSGSGLKMPEMTSETTLSIVHMLNNEELVVAGENFLDMSIKGRNFRVSANSFFQTNYSGAESLVDVVTEIINMEKPEKVLDVYCGVGLFSAFLADSVKSISGIEYSPTACDDFTENLDEFDNVSLYQGKAEMILPGLRRDFDCILVDPPRAGLRREAVDAIIKLDARSLIYVSCNPSTLARDINHFREAGYRLESSTILDIFPQTFHMESIVSMSKR